MDATLTTQPLTTQGPARAKLIGALKLAGSAALSIIVSAFVTWGAFQYAKGNEAARLDEVEKKVEKNLTREVFDTWANEQRDRLREINERLLKQDK